MKLIKLISTFAFIISLAFLGFFFFNMPKSPQIALKEPIDLDLSVFFADISNLNLPKDIFISAAKKYKNRYYISDAIAKKIYCIDENSNILWESKGEDSFILPNTKFPLDISEDGNLWVSNTGKLSLEQLDLETGEFIASWTPKDKFKGCCNPIAIVALRGGRFLTMEKGTNLLKLFEPDGSGKVLAKLNGTWENYELEKFGEKVEYCDGFNIKTIDINN